MMIEGFLLLEDKIKATTEDVWIKQSAAVVLIKMLAKDDNIRIRPLKMTAVFLFARDGSTIEENISIWKH